MASKKYKPALFELVNRGPIKPNHTGALKTPKWFYGSKKKNSVAAQQTGSKPLIPPTASVEPKSASRPIPVAPVVSSEPPLRESSSPGTAQHGESRVQVQLSYWVIGLIILALIFALLASYRLGQRSGRVAVVPTQQSSDVGDPVNRPSSSRSQLDNVPVRNGLVPQSARGSANGSSGQIAGMQLPGSRSAASSVSSGSINSSGVASSPRRSGQCLLMCRHDSKAVLKPVQDYFSRNGIATVIGRYGNSYVLCSEATFGSIGEVGAKKLKKQVAKIGTNYNSNKPKGSPGFTASTFAGAFWVNAEKIQIVSN